MGRRREKEEIGVKLVLVTGDSLNETSLANKIMYKHIHVISSNTARLYHTKYEETGV